MRRRWILFAGFVARMENTRLQKCVMFGEMGGGGRAAWGEQEKEWMVCFLDDLRAFSLSKPTSGRLLYCSPGRGGMAQDGGTRGGTFHGEMNRCRQSQGCTRVQYAVVYSNVTGRTKKRITQSKQGCSCWFARHKSQVARTCILRAFFGFPILLSFSGVTFVFLRKI